ncbi:MAG TPA: SPOR domain-containing protein [Stellaceae bacterium]|jgi:hypothetical protein|nr:SPOR domain-containing protein [Stellaceae bacterium]
MSYQQFGHVDPDERLDYSEEPPPDEEYPRRRLLPGVALVAGVMALFAGGLWFAYHAGTKHAATVVAAAPAGAAGAGGSAAAEQVPLLRAGTEPVKVKPEKAGGMTIPDRDDPLYALHPGARPAEHILPPPEAPAPRPTAPPPPPQVAALPPAAPMLQPMPAPLPAPPQVGSLPRAARPAAEAAKPGAAGGTVKVQLASLRTPDQARDEWARLKRENGDLLGRLSAVAVKADLGERGIWYKIEAGPVGDRAAAIKLCKDLKERDLGCQLVQ